jgi:hypothetical protein
MATTINSNTTDGLVITPDTSGEIELQADGVTKAKITANGLQDNNGNSLRGGSYRNLIINGDMRIAQRGTSATGKTALGYYTCDRFYQTIVNAGTWTITQDTDVPSGQGFVSSLKLDCTTTDTSLTATDQLAIGHKIEAQNLQHLKFGTSSAESITLSFWVKSNKTGTYPVWFQEPDATKHASKLYTIDTADTWEKKTITIAGDTSGQIDNNNSIGMTLQWGFASGSTYTSGTSTDGAWETQTLGNIYAGLTVNLADSTSNYINITGVQLEVGEGASDFEHLPYDVQLQRCQRYYWKTLLRNGNTLGQGTAISTTAMLVTGYFPTRMRTNPTGLSTSGTASDYKIIRAGLGTEANCSAVPGHAGATSDTAYEVVFYVSSGLSNGYSGYTKTGTADGFLAWSAEL